jgi:hypothetical protein
MISKPDDLRKKVESLVNHSDKNVALLAEAMLVLNDSLQVHLARIKKLEAEVARLRG